MKPTFDQQADCVRREILRRRTEYPRLVQKGVMSQGKADSEIETMDDVLATVLACKMMMEKKGQ